MISLKKLSVLARISLREGLMKDGGLSVTRFTPKLTSDDLAMYLPLDYHFGISIAY